MNRDVSIHLRRGEVSAHAISAANPTFDILRMRDARQPTESGVDIFLGHSDEETAEVALEVVEAVQEIRSRALRRMALREAADPITAAKAEADREWSGTYYELDVPGRVMTADDVLRDEMRWEHSDRPTVYDDGTAYTPAQRKALIERGKALMDAAKRALEEKRDD